MERIYVFRFFYTWRFGLGHLAILILGCTFSLVSAATITVNSIVDSDDIIDITGQCSLREAIRSANENTDKGGCTSVGSYGDDTIIVPSGLYFVEFHNNGTHTLIISSNITIQGEDTQNTIIDGSLYTSIYTDVYGLFDIKGDFNVEIKNLTIRNIDGHNGVRQFGGSLTLDSVYIHSMGYWLQNGYSGTGVVASGNQLTISNSTISNNSGSGIDVYAQANGQEVSISNSTISGNIKSGISFDREATVNTLPARLTHVTIANNLGLAIDARFYPYEVLLSNSIIEACEGFGIKSEGFNIISDNTRCLDLNAGQGLVTDQIGSSIEPIDLQMAPLTLNGGSTPTHKLLEASPAIDKGGTNIPSLTRRCKTYLDQRGEPRYLDGDGDGVPACDIGAFELAAPSKTTLTLSGNVFPTPVSTGGQLSLIATVDNLSPITAQDVQVRVSLNFDDLELESVPASCALEEFESFFDNELVTHLVCNIGSLEGNGQVTRSFTLKPKQTASVVTGSVSVNFSNNEAGLNPWSPVWVQVVEGTDLELVSPGTTTRFLNQEFGRTFTLTNNGPFVAKGIKFVTNFEIAKGVPLEYLGFESSIEGVGCAFASTTPTGRPLECGFEELASGETVTVTLLLKTPDENSEQTLSSSLSSSLADPDTTNNSLKLTFISSETGPPVDTDVFTMVSILDRPELIAEPFDYRLVFVNLSPTEATDVIVGVRAAELGFISASLNDESQTCGVLKDGIIACEIGSMKADSSAVLELKLNAPASASTVSIEAVVESALRERDLTNNFVSTRKEFRAYAADLEVNRAGLKDIMLNGEARFDFSVTNLGPDPAFGISLQYIVPKGFQLGVLPRGCSTVDDMISCAIASLQVGDTQTFSANVMATAEGSFTDEVRVISRSSDPVTSNNSTRGGIEVEEAQLATDLSLDIVGKIGLKPSESFDKTLRVAVNSNVPAKNVVLEGTLASNVSHVSNDASCSVTGQTIRCPLGDMEAGSEQRIELSLKASDTVGTEISQFRLLTDTPDSNSQNDSAQSDSVIVAATLEADLSIDLSGPSVAQTASDLSYLLTLTNASNNAVSNVSAVLELPDTLSLVSAEDCQKENNLIICMTDLAANESREFTLTLKAPTTETEVTLSATIRAQAIDNDDSNNQDSVTTRTTSSKVTVPMIKASANLSSLSDIELNVGSNNVSVLAFTLSNPLAESVRVKTMTFSSSGSGSDSLDLTAVRLYADTNNSGRQDAGDTLLGTGNFSQDNGDLTLNLNAPVELSANANKSFVVTVDVNNQLAQILGGALLGFLALGYISLKRHRTLGLTAVLLCGILLASCNSVQAPSSDSKTYELRLSRVNAEMVQGGGFVPTDGTPLRGITLTIK